MNELRYKLRLMWAYKDALRTRVPFLFNNMIASHQQQGKKAAQRLREKNRIDVAFMLTITGMWKDDYIFRLMQQSERYHPYVVIYPYSCYKGFSDTDMWEIVHKTEDFVKQRGYEYKIPYDKQKKKWLDIKKAYNPDIVFFTAPYRDTLPDYYVYHFKDRLTCYVPYAFQSMNLYKLNYDQIAINLYGLNFAETPMHLEFAKQYSRSKGVNFVCTGYPGTEVYLREDYHSSDVWKPQPTAKKRVIWAPHHTIDEREGFRVSTFLLYCDDMLRLAEKYQDSIQFAFKPHQLLKLKLYDLWGKERTDVYYHKWADLPNGQLEEGGYVDLFIHSDAMIHDSGSFTSEYLFLNKPVMYLTSTNNPRSQFNKFGELAFDQHYHGGNIEEITQFMDKVVLEGEDVMREQRQHFYDEYLAPREGRLPSEAILFEIEKMING